MVAQVLKENAAIQHLDLSSNALGPATCTAIAAVLAPRVSNLMRLILRHNDVGDRESIALAHGLKNNNTLLLLDLSHNCIGEHGAAALGTMLSENGALEVCHLCFGGITHVFGIDIAGEIVHHETVPSYGQGQQCIAMG
jgi:Ran GTPase-activating protein (RanGAP) involved in mRNA processing and transport